MVGVLGAFAALATCPDPPERELVHSARQVLQAFDAADADLLDLGRAGLQRSLPCLHETPSPATLRVLHRAMALLAYVDRDADASTRAWAALRTLDPTARPDPRRFPRGHGAWAAFEAVDDLTGESRPIPHRRRARWFVDGVRSRRVPGDRAFVLSARPRASGPDTTFTGYFYRPEGLPRLQRPVRPRARGVAIGVASGLVAAGTGVLAWGATLERSLLGGRIPPSEVLTKQSAANRRYALGTVLVGAGGSLGLLTFSIRR